MCLSYSLSREVHAREHDPDLQDSGRFVFSVGVHAVFSLFARRQAGRRADDRVWYLDGGLVLLDVVGWSCHCCSKILDTRHRRKPVPGLGFGDSLCAYVC